MKSREQIFYDWLLADDNYRKDNNPFSKMITVGASKWPKVILPKI